MRGFGRASVCDDTNASELIRHINSKCAGTKENERQTRKHCEERKRPRFKKRRGVCSEGLYECVRGASSRRRLGKKPKPKQCANAGGNKRVCSFFVAASVEGACFHYEYSREPYPERERREEGPQKEYGRKKRFHETHSTMGCVRMGERDVVLIVHNVRSIHNAASLFRTADGAGARIILSGYTPGPLDRFGRKIAAFSKVALGAENSVPWERGEVEACAADLKKAGFALIALEQHARAIPYTDFLPQGRTALIVGSEVGGIPETVLSLAETIIDIPMRGKKESLNVAVAAGIALYHLSNSLHQ